MALSILYDIAPADRQKEISQNNPTTPFGPAIFYPQIEDMRNYHNNALWPFVGCYWTLAQAKAANEQGVVEGIGSIFRPAALFCTNKENFNLDNGDYYTELNSSNMLWSLSGNIALTQQILFGIHFEKDGLRIAPFVPEVFAGERTLENFPYRGARLDITVNGYGDHIKTMTLNGKTIDPAKTIPAKQLAKGGKIVVNMADEPIAPMKINRVNNLKAPRTPQTWLEASADYGTMNTPTMDLLRWNPIEYIGEYIVLKDGKEVARTHQTEYPATEPGEWQVIGVASDGTQSFASEPRSNRPRIDVEFNDEVSQFSWPESSHLYDLTPKGYYGNGFVGADQAINPKPVEVTIDSENGGLYSIAVRYANGEGPVNTENKAAIRTLKVDGNKAGTLVMPQRGVRNWEDWGMSNGVLVELTPGKHTLEIVYLPVDENMNIKVNRALLDRITLEKVK